jgi:hypothetical protein
MKLGSTPRVVINNKWFSRGMTILIFSVAGTVALLIYCISERGKINPESAVKRQNDAISNMLGEDDPRFKK